MCQKCDTGQRRRKRTTKGKNFKIRNEQVSRPRVRVEHAETLRPLLRIKWGKSPVIHVDNVIIMRKSSRKGGKPKIVGSKVRVHTSEPELPHMRICRSR